LFAVLTRSERPFVPDPRETPKSKYTAERDIAGAFEGETVTRRRFMTLTAHGAGAVAASAFLLPALGFAAGSAIFERPEVSWETVGVPEDFPDDTYVPKVVTEVSGIGQTGKTTIYMRARNDDDPPPNPEALHAGTSGDFVAISTRCMHLGCPVRYVDASKKFICPCHGGVYDFTGKVSGGPPVRPLDHFYVRVKDGHVQVGPRYSVNSEFRRFPSYRDPGQALDGIGQYMYPGRFSTPQLD
jgi:menaquinol-cytochrome c reductase iron-sulfur subunit